MVGKRAFSFSTITLSSTTTPPTQHYHVHYESIVWWKREHRWAADAKQLSKDNPACPSTSWQGCNIFKKWSNCFHRHMCSSQLPGSKILVALAYLWSKMELFYQRVIFWICFDISLAQPKVLICSYPRLPPKKTLQRHLGNILCSTNKSFTQFCSVPLMLL